MFAAVAPWPVSVLELPKLLREHSLNKSTAHKHARLKAGTRRVTFRCILTFRWCESTPCVARSYKYRHSLHNVRLLYACKTLPRVAIKRVALLSKRLLLPIARFSNRNQAPSKKQEFRALIGNLLRANYGPHKRNPLDSMSLTSQHGSSALHPLLPVEHFELLGPKWVSDSQTNAA
jgi:hypothetical protein